MRKTRAIALIEVMVVCGIVLVLAAALGLVIAPALKKRGVETRVRTDLRQLAVAINGYMRDNDDLYPLTLNSLGKGVPRELANWNPRVEQYGGLGRARYGYEANYRTLQNAEKYNAHIRFDPNRYAMVSAPFYARQTGVRRVRWFRQPDGTYQQGPDRVSIVLGAWLDGHIDWKDDFDEWQCESAQINMLP